MKNNKIFRLTLLSMYIALGLILSYLESLFPILAGLGIYHPAMKIGLANVIVVIALYTLKTHEVAIIHFARILIMGILFGNIYSLLFSVAGGLCSFLMMVTFKWTKWLTPIGISMVGAIVHNIGQLIVASILMRQVYFMSLLPFYLMIGLGSGIIVGAIANMVIKRYKVTLTD